MSEPLKGINADQLKLARVMFAVSKISDTGAKGLEQLMEIMERAKESLDDPQETMINLVMIQHRAVKNTKYMIEALNELVRAESKDN